MGKADARSTPRTNRSICLPFTQDDYNQNIKDPVNFRKCIDERVQLYPEIFPPEISDGYRMKDSYFSKKLLTTIRRIDIAQTAYTIRPSYILPYITGITDDIENPLFFRKFGVPFWAISHVFGKNAMYWYRIEQTLGRNSIVGTTIRKPEGIPQHLGADEKHTKLLGDKVYVATTVGNLRNNIAAYRVAYDHPGAHRTSNMLDRLMQSMDRHLFSAQYFHGSRVSRV